MNTQRLEILCNHFGVSSAESNIKKIMKKYYTPLCDEIRYDRLGSIFGIKTSENKDAKMLMIASSLDEIGFMISEVKKDGTLSFIQLENIAVSSLLHQCVWILTRDNQHIAGVISTGKKAMEDKCEIKDTDNLFIECGLSYDEIKNRVHPGDLVSYYPNYRESGVIVMSKALFPRIFNEVTIELLERIRDEKFDFHIAAGGIAQSVIGYRGTKTATYIIRPDAAIALTAFDTAKKDVNLKDGVVTGYYDRQMLPSKLLLNDFNDKVLGKPYFGIIGNDGSFIHKTLKGAPTVSVGIALTNMGSANEICRIEDADALVDALYDYLHTIDSKKLTKFGFGGEDDGLR